MSVDIIRNHTLSAFVASKRVSLPQSSKPRRKYNQSNHKTTKKMNKIKPDCTIPSHIEGTIYDTKVHHIGADDTTSLSKDAYMLQRQLKKIDTYSKTIYCLYNKVKAKEFIDNISVNFKNSFVQMAGSREGTIFLPNNLSIISFYAREESIDFYLYGSKEFLEESRTIIIKYFDEYNCHIKWFYNERKQPTYRNANFS